MTKHFALSILLSLPVFGSLSAQTNDNTPKTIDYQFPKTYELAGVSVQSTGGNPIHEEALISQTGLVLGQKIAIPSEDVSQAIKKLWAIGVFSDIGVEIDKTVDNSVFLRFIVTPQPRLSKYTFSGGISKTHIDELRDKLRLLNGDPFTQHDESIVKNTIKRFYSDKGFLNADVNVYKAVDTTKNNYITLDIEVLKGKKVKINDIIIEGNNALENRQIKMAMKDTKEKSKINFKALNNKLDSNRLTVFEALGNLSYGNVANAIDDVIRLRIFSSSKFQANSFEADKNKIVELYNNKGYRDAGIIMDSTYMLDEANMNIALRIEEGDRYYFRNITWEGNSKYSDRRLANILGIQKGDIYDQSRLQNKLFFDIQGMDVSSLYMNDGYLFFQVTPEEVNIIEDSIDLNIKVYEGPQATIDKVIIKGNTKTKEHVIRRIVRTLPGNKFSRADIIRSQREIAATNLFDPEQIGIRPIPHPETGTVDIEYSVVEKPSDQIELSAGWGGRAINGNANSNFGGLYGTAGIVFNNFSIQNIADFSTYDPLPSGDAQQLSVRLQSNGRVFRSASVSFNEPWLGGKKPNSLSVAYNNTFFLTNQFVHRDSADAAWIGNNRITLGYGWRLKKPDDLFTVRTSLNYTLYNMKNFAIGQINGSGNGNSLLSGKVHNVNLTGVISRFSAGDNPQFPHRGSNISLSVAVTPPYSAIFGENFARFEEGKTNIVEYHKWRFNAEWYSLLAGSEEMGKRKLVLRTSAKIGFLGLYNRNVGLSPFEQFQLGGDGFSNQGGIGTSFLGYDVISLRGTEQSGTLNAVGSGSEDVSWGSRGNTSPIFNKFSAELRYPISLSQSSMIYVMAFAEAGNVYENFKYYDPTKLYRSTGIGVRLFLPMFGMLGFDYGIGIDDPTIPSGSSFSDRLRGGHFHFKLGFEPE